MTRTESSPQRTQSSSPRKKRRVALSLLIIIALIASAKTRDWAIRRREQVDNGNRGALTVASNTSLSAMPSFATALLLGGLRGPLVMMLWTSSETQKQQNDLEDIDTKIEWIRLLQPEFDAVHLFQIWNKAYNLSVKMTSLNNKYACVVDALDYARKVDQQRPDDINILATVGLTYSDKLGTSQESYYYKHRIRRETQTLMRVSFPLSREQEFRDAATKLGWNEDDAPLSTNPRTQTAAVLLEKTFTDRLAPLFSGSDVDIRPDAPRNTDADAFSARRLPRMLDIDGNILPPFLTPRYPRPADLPPEQPWYDGSQLQMIAKYQPFPYGLSTFALAYDNYKRSQLLQTLWHERPLQLSAMVIDSRSAIMLKQWARDEWEQGRRAELRVLGVSAPGNVDITILEQLDAEAPPNTPIADASSRAAADYSYTLAARLYADCRAELLHFIGDYRSTVTNYTSHVDDTIAMEQLMLADRDYLDAMFVHGPQQKALLKSAAAEYNKACNQFAMVVLKYWTDDSIMSKVFPKDPQTHQQYTRVTIASADPSIFMPVFDASLVENRRKYTDPRSGQYFPAMDQYYDNRSEYLEFIARCRIRLAILNSLGGNTATQPHAAATQP